MQNTIHLIDHRQLEPQTSQQFGMTACTAPAPRNDEGADPRDLLVDYREQLFNEGNVGPIDHIQVSTERIVRLNGILFDIDPQNLRESPLLPAVLQDPEQFYQAYVQRWLANH